MVVKKANLAAAVAFVMSLGFVAPAMADDEPMDKVVGGSLFPIRVVAAGVGAVVGTPIAAVRQTVKTYKEWTPSVADRVGGKDCGPCVALVSVATLPASMVYGGVTGLYYGTKNGVSKGFNNPFTHDSFSMGDDYDGGK